MFIILKIILYTIIISLYISTAPCIYYLYFVIVLLLFLRLLVIQFNCGADKLGFSIVGGKRSAHGDMPIFINKVDAVSAAGKDGQLRARDEILSVNGMSFTDLTHDEAAKALGNFKEDVKFTVRRVHSFDE